MGPSLSFCCLVLKAVNFLANHKLSRSGQGQCGKVAGQHVRNSSFILESGTICYSVIHEVAWKLRANPKNLMHLISEVRSPFSHANSYTFCTNNLFSVRDFCCFANALPIFTYGPQTSSLCSSNFLPWVCLCTPGHAHEQAQSCGSAEFGSGVPSHEGCCGRLFSRPVHYIRVRIHSGTLCRTSDP